MKKAILQAVFCLSAVYSGAQESYTIKMNIKTEGMPAEYAAYGEKDIVTYIKGDKSKSEVSSMMFSSTIFYDGKQLTSLTDVMGNKSGYTATKEELESSAREEKDEKPKIEYTSEKRNIAGYECTKAIVTSSGKDKKAHQTIYWLTNDIKFTAPKTPRGMGNQADLKGYPLAMETATDVQGTEMKIVMTTTEISTEKLDDSVFKIDTEGYKMMSLKEFTEQMKAAQKGH